MRKIWQYLRDVFWAMTPPVGSWKYTGVYIVLRFKEVFLGWPND